MSDNGRFNEPIFKKSEKVEGDVDMIWPFKRHEEASQTPPALDNRDMKLFELEMRIAGMEQAIIDLCGHLKDHLDRIDHNTMMLDKNMHNLASMTLRPPKDLLGGGQEPN